MNSLPSLITEYIDDYRLYHKIINDQNLSYLCMIKLLELYLPLKNKLTIEELIDVHDAGTICLSYTLVARLAQQLNLFHIQELFDNLVLIYDHQLKDHVSHNLYLLRDLEIITYCTICSRVLLLPSKYYYYICEYCDNTQYHHNQNNYFDNYICQQCNNLVTYYIIVNNLKFKLTSTSYQALVDNQGKKYFSCYSCPKECRDIFNIDYIDNITLKIYQKYNNFFN